MFKKEDFCAQSNCMLLKEVGFNDLCRYTYCKTYRVRDEIYEKHPGLSDDGYLDLTEEYGGSYKRDEIYGKYIEVDERIRKNSNLVEDFGELYVAPTIHEIIIWLIEKKQIVVTPKPYVCEDGIRWLVEIRKIGIDKISMEKTITCKRDYSDAANEGIRYVLLNMI